MKKLHDRLNYLRQYVKESKLKSRKKVTQNETFNLNYDGINGRVHNGNRDVSNEEVSVSKYDTNNSNKSLKF